MAMRKVKTVNPERVKNYTHLANLCRGTNLFNDFALEMEYKEPGCKWQYDGFTVPGTFEDSDTWYIKAINGVYLLYRLQGSTELERYLLKPCAIKFFNV